MTIIKPPPRGLPVRPSRLGSPRFIAHDRKRPKPIVAVPSARYGLFGPASVAESFGV